MQLEVAILDAIRKGVERLPNGKYKPANGITMLIELPSAPTESAVTALAETFTQKHQSILRVLIDDLGYKDIWVVSGSYTVKLL